MIRAVRGRGDSRTSQPRYANRTCRLLFARSITVRLGLRQTVFKGRIETEKEEEGREENCSRAYHEDNRRVETASASVRPRKSLFHASSFAIHFANATQLFTLC